MAFIRPGCVWSAITTVTSTGAVNGSLESLTGIGGVVPFADLGMSEVVFGGVGTGLYSMLVFVLLAVFIGLFRSHPTVEPGDPPVSAEPAI